MNNEATIIIDWIRNNCLQDAPDTHLSGGTLLLDEVGLDSLEIVRLVNFLEDEFQISVDVEELVPENFESVDRVLAMVQRIRPQELDGSTSEDQGAEKILRSETAPA
jgi:acyl carrier protein